MTSKLSDFQIIKKLGKLYFLQGLAIIQEISIITNQ
jgi:hypothetical protein